MKKNITINMLGRLYAIDEDAYGLLQQYIDTLRSYFAHKPDGKEIADDIEARIAELFDDLKAQGVEAINIQHVQNHYCPRKSFNISKSNKLIVTHQN